MNTSSFSHEVINQSTLTAQEDFKQGARISMYFFTIVTAIEAGLFLWTINLLKDFREDFNLLTEIKWFALSWLVFSNLILFITIQGSYSQWLSMA